MVVLLFCVEESLATLPVAPVVPVALVDEDEVEELGCWADVLLLLVSFEAVRPVPVAGSVAAAPAAGGVFAATSLEPLEPLVEERLEESDEGVVDVLEALRFVSLASEESDVEVERDVSAEVFDRSEVDEELSEPLAPTEPLPLSELLLEVEAVGAPETLLWAPLLVLLLSAVLEEDGDDDEDGVLEEPKDEPLFCELLFAEPKDDDALLLFWVELLPGLPKLELLGEDEDGELVEL